jgi:ATPase subunit of ABC transporter with duplicated ATPase domains
MKPEMKRYAVWVWVTRDLRVKHLVFGGWRMRIELAKILLRNQI